MTNGEIAGLLEFLRAAEQLKTQKRSGWTSAGEQESVAEHTWRVCLMALLVRDDYPALDYARLVSLCIVHDLGEAIGGDIPAPAQLRDDPLIRSLRGLLDEETARLARESDRLARETARLARESDPA